MNQKIFSYEQLEILIWQGNPGQIAKSKLSGSSLKHGESADRKSSILNFSRTRHVFSFSVTYDSGMFVAQDVVVMIIIHLLQTHNRSVSISL